MANYAEALVIVAKAAQVAQQAAPDIAEFSADHQAGTSALITDAANAFAASTKDPTQAAEAQISAALVNSVLPFFFSLAASIKAKATAKKAASTSANVPGK